MRICITGANGFVGNRLCDHLKSNFSSYSVLPAVRTGRFPDEIEVGNIDSKTRWLGVVAGCEVVVHLAARVHIMHDSSGDLLTVFREVNVNGTLNFARQAAQTGVRRFIYISSVKVNGEATMANHPFTAGDTAAPLDPYGVSKLEAERALRDLAAQTGMEVVIIRPPLVYGPKVRANFETLIQVIAKGMPLPLGAIQNKRSLVALDNLVDLIATCINHPNAANQTFMVSDGEDVSTPDLIRRIAQAMDRPVRVFYVPLWLLQLGAKLTGRSSSMQRLCGNLQVDISKTENILGWKPPISVDEGLRRAVAQWRQ